MSPRRRRPPLRRCVICAGEIRTFTMHPRCPSCVERARSEDPYGPESILSLLRERRMASAERAERNAKS